ncbi:DUF6270 domain-containing protein [Pseudarthrobacter sp. J64]|uniref:DUF6270 domain-containing protein n=1 Tax=Pseudarthrobacter sp. J64 TaxID=3116485 RepID=UPI002E8144EB|nr:DUF6270 domain-containing protein [Pseudarthrobacter sp. J64]MEE2568486.1 DUF6270 domain-containing protein [Pseudarthrobacter sp. J64]
MTKKVMIYGSCVSRDAFEELGTGYTLLGYVARQSVISALSRPTDLLDGEALGSAFQNRSLTGDLKSNLLPTLRRFAEQIDLFVVDLTDERLGVIRLPDGSYVTRSAELATSGRLGNVRGTRRNIDAATEEHWNLWESAATRLFGALTTMGLRDKTLVLNTPWADVTDAGQPVDSFRGLNQDAELTSYLAECCAHIRSLGYNVASLPEGLRVAHSEHKWGPAPYHFAPDANAWIAKQIRSAAQESASL